MREKTCTRCGKTKPTTQFYLRGDTRKDPYQSCCKECSKKKMKKWYAKNDAHQKEKSKKWRFSNLTHCLARDRKYYGENKEQHSESHKKWVENNRNKVRQINRNRRAREIGAEGSFTPEEFSALCEKYGNMCLCCGQETKLTADHVVPLVKGGTNWIDNIQPLCGPCNSGKKDKTIDYRKAYA